jgi:hypothetical protein
VSRHPVSGSIIMSRYPGFSPLGWAHIIPVPFNEVAVGCCVRFYPDEIGARLGRH